MLFIIFSETSVCQNHRVNFHGGSNVLCPGEIGLFECVLTDSSSLHWDLEGVGISFGSTHEIGSGPVYGYQTSSVGFLIGHSVTGNRTSILRYVPDRATMKTAIIFCFGDSTSTACNTEIVVVGVLAIIIIILIASYYSRLLCSYSVCLISNGVPYYYSVFCFTF